MNQTVAELRETLRAIEDDGHQRRPALPFGVPALDERLAGEGLRLDALHEVAPATACHGDEASATLFMAGIAARAWGPVLWVMRRRDLFAPGLYQAGLAPERLLASLEAVIAGTAAGDGAIISPMPGKIIALEVAAGEAVTKGQKLLTLEAMKMEHSLVAPFDGTVAELNAQAGAQVSEGALLARIEKGEAQ